VVLIDTFVHYYIATLIYLALVWEKMCSGVHNTINYQLSTIKQMPTTSLSDQNPKNTLFLKGIRTIQPGRPGNPGGRAGELC
jgi:hypothetical protein